IDGIRGEVSERGRVQEKLLPEGHPGIIDSGEIGLGGESPPLAQLGLALLMPGAGAPGLVLLVSEIAPRFRDRPELALRMLSGRGGLLILRGMPAVVRA